MKKDNKEYCRDWRQKNKDKVKENSKKYSKNRYDGLKIYKIVYKGDVIYIGKTILKLRVRKSCKNYSISDDIYKESEIELIEYTDDVSRERYWIEYYISIGAKLLNKRNGDHSINTLNDYRKKILFDNKISRNFTPKTDEEKNAKRREWRKKHSDRLNAKRREYYRLNKK